MKGGGGGGGGIHRQSTTRIPVRFAGVPLI